MVEERRIRLWQDKIETQIDMNGDGPPLVFLHGPWGLRSDRDFLDRLAATHRIYAPRHPGTTPGDPDAIHQLDEWWDLVVYYGELLDRLGLGAPALVGHSFGGMVACEIAAAMPERVKRLVLIDPLGLWRDELPVNNWMILPDDQRRQTLFADPAGAAAERFFELPAEPGARAEAQAGAAGVGYVTIDVFHQRPGTALLHKLGVVDTPEILVVRRPGVITSQFKGFVDRDVVAQAVADAR